MKWIIIITAASFAALCLHLASTLFTHVYHMGYNDGIKGAPTTAQQCHSWWFGGGQRHAQELKQFCKRSDI
jgi:hypothetical protein